MAIQKRTFPKLIDFFCQLVILYSLAVFAFEPARLIPGSFFYYSELIVTIIFMCEYVGRVILSDNRKKYILSLAGIIDVLAFIPFIVTLGLVDLKFLRILRLFRILRIFKLARYSEAMDRLSSTFLGIRSELIIFFSMSFMLVYLASVGIHYFERQVQPEKFGTIADCMWWSIATLTTVGYGDVYPMTPGGKVFTGLLLIVALSIISIPSGLIASSFTRSPHKS
ncbi:MAG: voltage-gated potassium channel [Zetaproteobacteria bacterium]|nr:voltage-gated potassium channel [Pseudobdellovibrionaceae bacterium]